MSTKIRNMPPATTCPNCGLAYYQTAAPHVCAEWTKGRAKENQVVSHQRNTSGNCSISGCPCRGWSAQESVNEHEHEPPARAGEGEHSPLPWVVGRNDRVEAANGRVVADMTFSSHSTQRGPANALLIVTAVNQRHRLLAERDRLLKAAQFSLTTPGSSVAVTSFRRR